MKCFMCRRDLKNPISLQKGYGEDCAKKYQQYLADCATTEEEITSLEGLQNLTIIQRLTAFRSALGRRNLRDANQLLRAARREARRVEADAAGLVEGEFWDYVNGVGGLAKATVWGVRTSQFGSGLGEPLPLFTR